MNHRLFAILLIVGSVLAAGCGWNPGTIIDDLPPDPAGEGFVLLTLFIVLFSTNACQKAYYSTMEKFGVHKRDIMVDRVGEARDSQEEAKEQ